jgi:hypothetical protein
MIHTCCSHTAAGDCLVQRQQRDRHTPAASNQHTHGTAWGPHPRAHGAVHPQAWHPAVPQAQRLAAADINAVAMLPAVPHQLVHLARVAAQRPARQEAQQLLVLELCCRARQLTVPACMAQTAACIAQAAASSHRWMWRGRATCTRRVGRAVPGNT